MSNCASRPGARRGLRLDPTKAIRLPSGVLTMKVDVVTDRCVEHCDHLAHDRDDHDLVEPQRL
jgi:hypothetical protein